MHQLNFSPDGGSYGGFDESQPVPEPSPDKRDSKAATPFVGDPKVTLGPGDPPPFGDVNYGIAYWDARHAAFGEEQFDWYMGYDRLSPLLHKRLPTSEVGPEILDVGCGTSEFPSRLYNDGWKNVIGIDTSVVAINQQKQVKRHGGCPELQFIQMDVCHLRFPDECFNIILDKALFDTIVTGGHAYPRVRAMLTEIYRVLKQDGIYICITHAPVGARLPWFILEASWQWTVEACRIAKPPPTCLGDAVDEMEGDSGNVFFYVFILTKCYSDKSISHDESGSVSQYSASQSL